MILYFIKI